MQLGCQKRFFDCFGAGFFMGDDFQQAIFCRMVEIMQSDKPIRPTGFTGKFVNVKARGVGGQYGFIGADPIQFLKKVEFNLLVLKNSLYDQVGVGHHFKIAGADNARENIVKLL